MNFLLLILISSMSLSLLSNQSFSKTINMKRGYLFSIEGTEGCGKTTLIKNLKEKLNQINLQVITTREPGSTELGKTLRSILMNRSVSTCTLAEFLLFAADRAQHFQELIMPALAENKIVICDRMADSSLVYQGYVKGLDQAMIKTINAWAMQYQQPDIIFYLKIDATTAMNRMNRRNELEGQDAFEAEILEKKQLLVHGYDTILTNRSNVIIIDAAQSAEIITKQVLQAITTYLQNNP